MRGQLHKFLDIHQHNHTNRNSRPLCNSTEDVSNTMSLLIQDHPCTISWYQPSQICQILHQYSLVVFYGDSLTRHTMQTVMMILKGDLRYGGYPLYQIRRVYNDCGCDVNTLKLSNVDYQ